MCVCGGGLKDRTTRRNRNESGASGEEFILAERRGETGGRGATLIREEVDNKCISGTPKGDGRKGERGGEIEGEVKEETGGRGKRGGKDGAERNK